MALSQTRTCDFTPCDCQDAEGTEEQHLAQETLEIRYDTVSYEMDVCNQHLQDVFAGLHNLGFKPSRMTVGKARRGVYLSASGATFSARDARHWHMDRGDDSVSETGRLTQAQIEAYANTH